MSFSKSEKTAPDMENPKNMPRDPPTLPISVCDVIINTSSDTSLVIECSIMYTFCEFFTGLLKSRVVYFLVGYVIDVLGPKHFKTES